MTKVGKSHSKGTFVGAFGNDEDALIVLKNSAVEYRAKY
jgi:hypothetical protein